MIDNGVPDGGREFLSPEAAPPEESGHDPHHQQSLTEDVIALIDDGKTYVEAELAFQKSRLAFTADKGKSAAALGIAALALVHLALIALVVGAVIILSPILSPLGATALVVVVLLIGAAILGMSARKHARHLADAYAETRE